MFFIGKNRNYRKSKINKRQLYSYKYKHYLKNSTFFEYYALFVNNILFIVVSDYEYKYTLTADLEYGESY